MSTFDYTSLANRAASLIERFGVAVTLDRTDITTDPVTGLPNGNDGISQSTTGVVWEYQIGEIDGTRIKNGDVRLLLDNTVEPLKTDIPKIAGTALGSIIDIKTIKPANSAVIYILQVRG